jgi:hypothetical protein
LAKKGYIEKNEIYMSEKSFNHHQSN